MKKTTTYRKDIFHETVGVRLRELREQAGISKAMLAKMCGVSNSTIDHAELGHGYPYMLAAVIAHHLDVTMDDLTPIDAVVAVTTDQAAE